MTGELTCVGAIAGAFGVRGELRVKSFCANPKDIGKYSPLVSEDGTKHFDLKISRTINNGFAVRISGVDNKEDADALKGTRLYVPIDRLPKLPDDEFYHTDLIGLEVVDSGGNALGHVTSVHDHGAGDILEIKSPGQPPVLIPFTKLNVPTVDLAAKRVIVDPPEGLFSDD